jgi:hypothetical protein
MYKYLLLFCILLPSCYSKPKEAPFVLQANAKSLLTNDSTKSWKISRRFNDGVRMNMGDCFLSYRLIYSADMSMRDNNSEHVDCGNSLEANWQFVRDKKDNYYVKLSSEQLPELMNIDKEHKYFKILHLSADSLILQFRHRQFSDKWRTITDHYVPEEVYVKDRAFHW